MTRLLRAAGSISAFTLLSRILGLWRDRLMAQTLGPGWVQDTFLLAWALPNVMRRLLGEGALSASLVPAYAKARLTDPAAARALLSQVVGAVITLLAPVCFVVAMASLTVPAEWLPLPVAGGQPAVRLLLALNAVLFAYSLPVCLTAVCSGALNTLGSFALPAATPLIINGVWIAALLLAEPLGFVDERDIVVFDAWCLSVGGFLQLLVVALPLWLRGELQWPPLRLPARGTAAAGVFVTMAPTMLGMSLNQISSLLDQGLAYCLIPQGAVTYIYLATRLLQFPHALTAMAVAVAVFPKLAEQANDVGRARMAETLQMAAATTILVTLPAAAGLIVLGDDVVRCLFLGGRFTEADVWPTVLTSGCLVAGLPFVGLAQLYARAYYAVGDNAAPARLAVKLVLANALANVVLLMTTDLGTAALAITSSASGLANALLLAYGFRRHAKLGSLRNAWLRSLVATTVLCLVLPFTRVAPADGSWLAKTLGNVALPIGVGIAVYVLAHVLLRSPELGALRRRRRG